MLTRLIFSLTAIPSTLAFTATSWGENRLDVFGLFPVQHQHPKYWHKYYTNASGWEPHDTKLENLGGPPTKAQAKYQDVSSVSWGPNHVDFFVTIDGVLSHDHPPQQAGGTGRIDVVSRDEDGKYLHLYYNSNDEGGEWTGWEDHWNSPKEFSTDPVIIAPEEGHFDVFGRLSNGTIAHLYWNGEEYSGWTLLDWKAPEHGWGLSSSLTASTWKNGSWDLWTLDAEGSLWHTFWRGAPVNEFFAWENITDRQQFNVTPNVVHWSAGHTDISGVENGTFYHKSWDGSGWTKWNAFGEGFASLPEVVSWGEGQYAVFGIDGDGLLWGAMYVDGYWKDWEKLEDVTPGDEQQVRPGRAVDSGGQYVLEGYKQGL